MPSHQMLLVIWNKSLPLTDIDYLQTVLPPTTEGEFFKYLRNLNTNEVTLRAIEEGTVVFPKVPLLRIEGPLPIVQLLETTLLTLVNYARHVLNFCFLLFRRSVVCFGLCFPTSVFFKEVL